jgi:putative transposase
MPSHLKRFHEAGQTHFITFSCYQRRPGFTSPEIYDLFVECLEAMRRRYTMCIYGYIVMPEHVHLLISEPESGTVAEALHFLKLSFAKRLRSGRRNPAPFWQKRYYDRNVRDADEFRVKLRYLHRNPVKRGLVSFPEDWKWSSFRHYSLREKGVVEIESEWTASDRETQSKGGQSRIFLTPG